MKVREQGICERGAGVYSGVNEDAERTNKASSLDLSRLGHSSKLDDTQLRSINAAIGVSGQV